MRDTQRPRVQGDGVTAEAAGHDAQRLVLIEGVTADEATDEEIAACLGAAADAWVSEAGGEWALWFGNCRDFAEDVMQDCGLTYGRDRGADPGVGQQDPGGKKGGDDKKAGDDKNDGKTGKKDYGRASGQQAGGQEANGGGAGQPEVATPSMDSIVDGIVGRVTGGSL